MASASLVSAVDEQSITGLGGLGWHGVHFRAQSPASRDCDGLFFHALYGPAAVRTTSPQRLLGQHQEKTQGSQEMLPLVCRDAETCLTSLVGDLNACSKE